MPRGKPAMDLDDSQDGSARKGFAELNASFEKGKPLEMSPVKEKLSKIRKILVDESAQGSAGSSSAGSNQIMDAIEALSNKMDRMALKSDLDQMETNLKKDMKISIAEAVDPLKLDVYDLKAQVDTLKGRVDTMEADRPMSPPKEPVKAQSLFNKFDPAVRRIAFIGFPSELSPEERIDKIEKFLAEHVKTYRTTGCDNNYSGPYNDRKLTQTSFAEFTSSDAAKRVLQIVADKPFKIGEVAISIKNARSAFNSARNYSPRKAEELIKASPTASGKTVKIEWPIRKVTVNDDVALSQRGSFHDPFHLLELP